MPHVEQDQHTLPKDLQSCCQIFSFSVLSCPPYNLKLITWSPLANPFKKIIIEIINLSKVQLLLPGTKTLCFNFRLYDNFVCSRNNYKLKPFRIYNQSKITYFLIVIQIFYHINEKHNFLLSFMCWHITIRSIPSFN